AKYRTPAIAVLDVDPAVVFFHDARAHREAQARAALAFFGRVERVEDLVANVGRDADAGVPDREADERLLGATFEPGPRAAHHSGFDRELTAVGHRLHRVQHEINHHLLQAIAVARDARQPFGALEPRPYLGARELTREQLHRRQRQLVEVDVR